MDEALMNALRKFLQILVVTLGGLLVVIVFSCGLCMLLALVTNNPVWLDNLGGLAFLGTILLLLIVPIGGFAAAVGAIRS